MEAPGAAGDDKQRRAVRAGEKCVLSEKSVDRSDTQWYSYNVLSTAKMLDRIRTLDARRSQLLAALRFLPQGMPGSLAEVRGECRSRGCHCHRGEPHHSWILTYMVEGKKVVEYVPAELLDEVRVRVQEGNSYKSQVAELMAINAQLLFLQRRVAKQQQAAAKRSTQG